MDSKKQTIVFDNLHSIGGATASKPLSCKKPSQVTQSKAKAFKNLNAAGELRKIADLAEVDSIGSFAGAKFVAIRRAK